MTNPRKPGKINVQGTWYTMVLGEIRSRYENGSPQDVTLLKPNEMVDLTDVPQGQKMKDFMTVYVSNKMLRILDRN